MSAISIEILCLTVSLFHSPCASETARLPHDLNGVWKVTAATDNGRDQPLAQDPDGSLCQGECGLMEVILTDNRLVLVSTDGTATVGQIKILTHEPQLRIECTGFGYHAKRDGPSYAILRQVEGNKIQIAFTPRDADRIDTTVGGEQFVLTATQ